MKTKILSLLLSLFIVSFVLGVRTIPVLAQGGDTNFVESCPPNAVSEDCQPPTLQTLEFLVVRIIYAAWALGGFFWLGYFIFIATKYLRGDPQQIEDAKKRFGIWVVGIFVYYLSYVIVGQFMSLLIKDGSACYNQFDGTPGFTFFFAQVCT